MLKRLIALMIVGWMLGGVVSAGVIIGGARTSGGGETPADYVPATAEIYFGTNPTAGSLVKIAIYDSSRNFIASSNEITKSEDSIVSGNITSSALTAGNTYFIVFTSNGYVPVYYVSSATNIYSYDDDGYPTFVDPLPEGVEGSTSKSFLVRIKNANGDVLIGESFDTVTDTMLSIGSGGRMNWNEKEYTCVTL